MEREQGDAPGTATAERATRCQLLLALLFLFGFSLLCWLIVARLLG